MQTRRLVVLFVFLSALSIFAQTSGEITGSVTDSSGAVVPAAKVTINNLATSQTRQVETNETGNFTVPFLSPGTYRVLVEKQGFCDGE